MLQAARELAAFGWPVLPVAAGAKEPLTVHGVKDATTDDVRIGQWWRKWPDANVGVATGAPGPTVLDIDDLGAAAQALPELENLSPPQVATPRGRHLYFEGQARGTINLGYGELRGTGSYVVAPPSVHPSGKLYVWLTSPNGPLPSAPGELAAARSTKGSGTREPVKRVSHGERHDYLVDFATRQVRGGITDPAAIEAAVRAEFERVCDRKPAPLPMAFRKIAEWAAATDIAERENAREARPEPKRTTKRRQLPPSPARDAPLGELRTFIAGAMGLPDVIRVDEVKRFGPLLVDPLHIKLSTGMRVVFDEQSDVTAPRRWRDVIQVSTSGIGKPGNLTGPELGDVLWALCVVSNATEEQREEDDLQQLVDDLVTLTEVLRGSFDEVAARYELLGAIKDRGVYEPRDAITARPTLVVDMRSGQRYLRASELLAFAHHRGLGIGNKAFAGRMRTIGVWRRVIQAHGEGEHRRQTLYELPPEVNGE